MLDGGAMFASARITTIVHLGIIVERDQTKDDSLQRKSVIVGKRTLSKFHLKVGRVVKRRIIDEIFRVVSSFLRRIPFRKILFLNIFE